MELLSRQVAIGIGAADELEERLLSPFLASDAGDDLLGQDVKGLLRDLEPVQLPPPDGIDQRGHLDQLVARQREEPPLGKAAHRVARPSDPLHQRGDGACRAELADQVHGADVDAQLERGGGDEGPKLPRLETLLRREPLLPREAAVVRGHVFGTDPIGEVPRHALRHPPRVDEDKRGPVLADQSSEPVIDLLPHLPLHDRLQRRARQLDCQVEVPRVAGIDDGAVRRAARRQVRHAEEEARDLLDRILRGRQSDAHQLPGFRLRQSRQPLERERQV